MKKILLTIFVMLFVLTSTQTAQSFVRYEEKQRRQIIEIQMSSFLDYAPIGWSERNSHGFVPQINTLLKPILDTFETQASYSLQHNLSNRDTDELVQKVRAGEIDIFVGAYSQTEMFKGLYLLYPAPFVNPITVFMLPNRISEVSSVDDLKKLKGVRVSSEIYSDFVSSRISELNPLEADSPYQAFEKLFTREADYIIGGYYYIILEASRLGIKHQIAPAKQALWNVPIFIGVAKTSRHRDRIARYMTKILNDEKNIDMVKQNLNKIIHDFDIKYQGVVPPTFGLEKTTKDTLAGENINNPLDAH